MEAITKWCEVNGVKEQLDQISPEVYESNRKGNLTDLFEDNLGIELSRLSLGDEQPRCFITIELEAEVRDLIEYKPAYYTRFSYCCESVDITSIPCVYSPIAITLILNSCV